jgi:predicted dehydrogenase
VVIATPEHWHALMTIDACDAGKDVYVEKPASHHIRDGRLMVEAARRKDRVVQVGSQQRSGAHFQRVVKYIQEGRLGDIHYASCWYHALPPPPRPLVSGAPPATMDWELWLGPAPKLSYEEALNIGRRGYWSLFGGMLTEWGAHLSGIVLWAMKVAGPQSVVAAGARFNKKPGEIPDTLQVTYTFPNFLFHYSVLGHNSYGLNGDVGAARFGSYGIQFHGTKGTLFVDRGGFRVIPQPIRHEEANQPPPAPTSDSRQTGFYYTTEILPEQSDSSLQHGPHVRNFLDCVKSRKRPNADIEAGHRANTIGRLGNIAYRVGRKLRWDPVKEQVLDDAEANRLAIGSYRVETARSVMRAAVSIALLLACAHVPAGSAGHGLRFVKRQLMVNRNQSATVGDLNRDGHPDIVYGAYWFAGPDFVPRVSRPDFVSKDYIRTNSDHVYDVDHDG